MKKSGGYRSTLLPALIFLTGLFLIGCDTAAKQGLGNVSAFECLDEYPGVEIEIVDGTLTPTGLTVYVKGDPKADIIYGEEYYVEKLFHGKWYEINPKEEGLEKYWHPVGYDLDTEHEYDWDWYYGALGKGTYRFILGLAGPGSGEDVSFYLATEFVID